ncbi:MAG TPA: hypothetical protein VE981_08970 [Planctomycetota bacterium]|nr:hypothetical protein [Planctomycetota bacterium]
MDQQVCEHFRALEDELVAQQRNITFAGQAWSANCRHWIYFDAVLDCEALKKRLNLGETVTVHSNDDPRSGREKGLVCNACRAAVVGIHPEDARGKAAIS